MMIELLTAGVIALSPGATEAEALPPCRDGATITVHYDRMPRCNLDGDNQLNIRMPNWWSNPTRKNFADQVGGRLNWNHRLVIDADF